MADADSSSFEDALFLERLDVFLEKSLDDLRDFARREERDFDQIRLRASEWHSKHLFEVARTASVEQQAGETASAIVDDVLIRTSKTLESLESVAGRHSLLLVVDPTSPDTTDDDFLGGTTMGREFWRGLRNGGAAGARNFKEYCRKASGVQTHDRAVKCSNGTKQTPAVTMKNNLYTEMRSKLRAISGVRSAEMKWSKPDKLSIYGVALEGWPRNIEYKNPSKMTFSETSTLMQSMLENKLYFRSLRETADTSLLQSSEATPSSSADVSWALNEDNDDPVLSVHDK